MPKAVLLLLAATGYWLAKKLPELPQSRSDAILNLGVIATTHLKVLLTWTHWNLLNKFLGLYEPGVGRGVYR